MAVVVAHCTTTGTDSILLLPDRETGSYPYHSSPYLLPGAAQTHPLRWQQESGTEAYNKISHEALWPMTICYLSPILWNLMKEPFSVLFYFVDVVSMYFLDSWVVVLHWKVPVQSQKCSHNLIRIYVWSWEILKLKSLLSWTSNLFIFIEYFKILPWNMYSFFIESILIFTSFA